MSLEAALAANTAALTELLTAIKALAYAEQKAVAIDPPATPVAPAPIIAPVAPIVQQLENLRDAAQPVSFDQVKAVTLKLAGAKGRDAALAVLKTFNAAKATELKPSQYSEFLAAAEAAL